GPRPAAWCPSRRRPPPPGGASLPAGRSNVPGAWVAVYELPRRVLLKRRQRPEVVRTTEGSERRPRPQEVHLAGAGHREPGAVMGRPVVVQEPLLHPSGQIA